MVSTYYLIKLLRKSNSSKASTHKENEEHDPKSSTIILKQCRVCLLQGDVPIFAQNTSFDFSLPQYLSLLGGIQISANDTYPKYLCKPCLTSLKAAIQFRKTAMKTELKLKEIERCIPNKQRANNNHKDAGINATDSKLPINSSYQQETIHNKSSNYLKNKQITGARTERVKYQCQKCKKILKLPKAQHHCHLPNVKPQFVCEFCGKIFKVRSQFLQHSKHAKELLYKCESCPYQGSSWELLRNHKKVHSGYYNYVCSMCPRKFLHSGNLNFHLRRHSEPKFQCNTCNRRFYEANALKNHFDAQHLGITKKVLCNLCGKIFRHRKYMLHHQHKVHKTKKTFSRAYYHNFESSA